MSEWWVDPDDGLTTNDGTSSSTPWRLIPGQTGASSQTGYTVSAGDTINIKNGTTTALRIIAPADNLTYRGYGVASNVLTMRLPSGLGSKEVAVVRSAGSHEGMWTLQDDTATTSGMFAFFTRSGVTVEDMHIVMPLSAAAVTIGTSTSTAIGATMRRCRVTGSDGGGINAYTRQLLLEEILIENVDDDAIIIGASSDNGYRSGYTDTLRRISIVNPGVDNEAFLGDAIQASPSSNRYESRLVIEDLYVYKANNTKQGIVLADMSGGFLIKNFYIDGPADATSQILISGLDGHGYIGQGVVAGACASHPFVRISDLSGASMATGSSLTIEAIILIAETNNGLFSWAAAESASTVDGAVKIHNCHVAGNNVQNLSYSGTISAHPGGAVTLGGNQSLTVRNNVIAATGQYAFRMPTGTGGSGLYVFENNVVAPDLTFAIGSTAYATLAAFEAAHTAGNNVQDDPLLDSSYRPISGSPVIGAGIQIPDIILRDLYGKHIDGTPDIGAIQYRAPRSAVIRQSAAGRSRSDREVGIRQ